MENLGLGSVDLLPARRRRCFHYQTYHTVLHHCLFLRFCFSPECSNGVCLDPPGRRHAQARPAPAAVMHEFEGSSDETREEARGERRDQRHRRRNGQRLFRSVPSHSLSPSLPPSLLRGWLDHDAAGGVQRGRSSLLIIIIVRRAWRRLDSSLALVDGGLLLF